MDTILDLNAAPDDPLERMIWLSGVEARVTRELEDERMRLAYEIRLSGGMDALIALDIHPRTKVLAWSRAENRRRGQAIRWGDDLDSKSGSHKHRQTPGSSVAV